MDEETKDFMEKEENGMIAVSNGVGLDHVFMKNNVESLRQMN
jgi:hypothetical protein